MLTCPDFEMLAINGGVYLLTVRNIPGSAAVRISAISNPVKLPDEK